MTSHKNRPWLAAAGLSIMLAAALVVGAVRGDPRSLPDHTYGPFLPTFTPTPATVESPGLPIKPEHQATPAPRMPDLAQAVRDLEKAEGGRVGVAIVPVHRLIAPAPEPWTAGTLLTAPAWQTINVPLGVAATESTTDFREIEELVDDAIARDGDGQALWERLGTPREAANAVTTQLRKSGDLDTVVNENYPATAWSLDAQATYISSAVCLPADRQETINRMSRIAPDERWGLGELPTTVFKGGAGTDDAGRFVARQMGTVKLLDGSYFGVAFAAQAASGTREDATALITQLAHLVDEKAGGMTGGC